MTWYYSKNGAQLGPVSQEELVAMLSSGSVGGADLVWSEGMPNWIPAASVPQLQSTQLTSAPPLFSGQAPLNPYSPPQTNAASPYVYTGETIPNYLWQSIVVTLLCCLPFGVVAIVFAAKVDSLVKSGDIAGAKAASKSAKTWCLVSFWIFVGFMIISIVIPLIGGMIQGASESMKSATP